MNVIEVPVLIVGGGGAGLSASNLLADLGVESLLVERHPGTSHLPKAHYLNQRTMEIFRHHGIDAAIYAKGAPPENMGKIIWHTSLGGDGPMDNIVLQEQDAMGGGRYAIEHQLKGAARSINIPQIRIEPVLREIAEQRNPGRVHFRHELISFSQDDSGVTAIIRDINADETYQVNTQYLIAADAGKTIGPALGVNMIGPDNLGDFVMVYMKADLSKHISDDRSVMRVIMHTEQNSGRQHTGGLLACGPTHWDRRSEEWGVGWGYAPNDPERHNEDNIVERIQEFLKVDVPIEVMHISHWQLQAIVADKFRVGRTFIVGDAAHKHAPFGGLGLNSGIQDVHNLCWKLALVLQGKAADSLLDSYEPERQPVVQRNAQNSLVSFSSHMTIISAMGLVPGAPIEYNQDMFRRLLADDAEGAQRRARLDAVFKSITGSEYAPHDLEMGYQYVSNAIVDDGTPPAPRDPLGSYYTPTTRPGCRLPHAWLHRDGTAVSTHDLIPKGGFLLLTGTDGGQWCAIAQQLAAELGVTLHAYRVGAGGDVSDPSSAWAQLCDIDNDGAILVRPDAHIAMRSNTGVTNAYAALRSAFNSILA